MASKKPLPPMMDVNVGKNPPFVPETFRMTVGPPPPKGTHQTTVGLYAKLYDYSYAGQNQTSQINIKLPKPVGVEPQWAVAPGAPWEAGCGPTDPLLSASFGSYAGSGYGARGGTGKVGTINAGASTAVTPGPAPAQIRTYIGSDGKLYALDNQTGQAFAVASATPVPQPPIYSPTK